MNHSISFLSDVVLQLVCRVLSGASDVSFLCIVRKENNSIMVRQRDAGFVGLPAAREHTECQDFRRVRVEPRGSQAGANGRLDLAGALL